MTPYWPRSWPASVYSKTPVSAIDPRASEDVRKKLEVERPEAGNAAADVAGRLHAMFGPASNDYFTAKKTVGAQHQLGNLGEAQILEYAQARKLNEAIVALSLSCSLPVDVVERAMLSTQCQKLINSGKIPRPFLADDHGVAVSSGPPIIGFRQRISTKSKQNSLGWTSRPPRRCCKPITRVRSRWARRWVTVLHFMQSEVQLARS